MPSRPSRVIRSREDPTALLRPANQRGLQATGTAPPRYGKSVQVTTPPGRSSFLQKRLAQRRDHAARAAPVLSTGLLPGAASRRQRRGRRQHPGFCPSHSFQPVAPARLPRSPGHLRPGAEALLCVRSLGARGRSPTRAPLSPTATNVPTGLGLTPVCHPPRLTGPGGQTGLPREGHPTPCSWALRTGRGTRGCARGPPTLAPGAAWSRSGFTLVEEEKQKARGGRGPTGSSGFALPSRGSPARARGGPVHAASPPCPPPGRGMPHARWEVADYFEIGRTLKTGVKTSFPSFESCIILRTDMSKLLDYNPLSVCFVIE